jgi:hypothetical protein
MKPKEWHGNVQGFGKWRGAEEESGNTWVPYVVSRDAPYILYRDMLQFLSGELWLLVREGEDFLEKIILKKIVNFSNIIGKGEVKNGFPVCQ